MEKADLVEAIADCVNRNSAQVIEISQRGKGDRSLVEIFVDSEQGVTSDLCAAISRDVASAIDLGGLIRGSYNLIVSSPGIDRPLKFLWQYKKHIGRTLLVQAASEHGEAQYTGRLIEVDDVAIQIEERGGQTLTIGTDRIREAVVKAPW